MLKLSFPPVTRASVVALLTLSTAAFTLRYLAYLRLSQDAAAPQEQPDSLDPGVARPQTPSFGDILAPYLTVVPGLSVAFPWVLATGAFVEQSVIGLAMTGLTLAYGGRYCERVWSSKQLLAFLGVVAIIPNLIAWSVFYMLFAATGDEEWLLESVHGGIALQVGFCVAFKQLVPEHVVVLFHGIAKAQVKYLVVPAVLAYTLIGALFHHPAAIVLAWAGFLTTWVYLRFYKVGYVESVLPMSSSLTAAETQRTKVRGDASDTFALSEFFYPQPVRDVVAAVSSGIYRVLVAVRVCTPFNEEEIEAGNMRANVRTGSVSSSAESERRRAFALRVLEERLQK
ncbi:transmembrane protein 115 homolog [Trichomonascus vanleenenianus]|uniref:rhomboid family protein n=1 Tax=Trichomonascus vanleenenianus TaxID=2268995 RepID=UPI003EC9C7AD